MKKEASILLLVVVGVFLILVSPSIVVFAANQSITYATVTIVNTGPTVVSVTVTPDPANPEDTMTVIANISDPNGVPNDINTVQAVFDMGTGATGDDTTVSLSYNSTSGFYQNDTFTLALNATPGTWTVNVTATDDFSAIHTAIDTFTVNTIVALTLHDTPIDFGNVSVGATDRRADNSSTGNGYTGGTIKGFPIGINNTGNVNENFTISGLNLVGQTDSAYAIGVSNITYNLTGTNPGLTTLTGTDTLISGANNAPSVQDVYFWIDTPNNIPEQEYRGNVTLSAIQS